MIAVGSLEPACDEHEWLDSTDDYQRVGHHGRLGAADAAAGAADPRLCGSPTRRSASSGIYDVADDWIPIYDRTDLDGFYVAIGTSGNQFKNAPFAAHAHGRADRRRRGRSRPRGRPVSVRAPTPAQSSTSGSSRATGRQPDSSFSVHG